MSLIIIGIYFHSSYNGPQSMSLPLKVRARICPKGIHFTDAHIWVWGWMLGVGGGNWFNVSEAMPAVHNTQKTATEEGCGRRGVCVCVCVRVGRATWVTVASNKSNHLPSRQLVLFWSLKLLMRKKDMRNCDLYSSILSHKHTMSPLPLPCQLISRPSRYCYKV